MRKLKQRISAFLLDRTMRGPTMNAFRPGVAGKAKGIVAEIGFGSGLNLSHYPTTVEKVFAIDPSQELFALAQDGINHVAFPVVHLPVSAEAIPLEDNFVDSVVSTWSLCTIPNPLAALKEVKRILKPDGVFIFIEHGASPHPMKLRLQRLLNPLSKKISSGCHLDRNIEELIRVAGFNIVELETFATQHKPLAHMYRGTAVSKNTL